MVCSICRRVLRALDLASEFAKASEHYPWAQSLAFIKRAAINFSCLLPQGFNHGTPAKVGNRRLL